MVSGLGQVSTGPCTSGSSPPVQSSVNGEETPYQGSVDDTVVPTIKREQNVYSFDSGFTGLPNKVLLVIGFYDSALT